MLCRVAVLPAVGESDVAPTLEDYRQVVRVLERRLDRLPRTSGWNSRAKPLMTALEHWRRVVIRLEWQAESKNRDGTSQPMGVFNHCP
jgi:hypothetical protein